MNTSDYNQPIDQLIKNRGGIMALYSHLLNETIYFVQDKNAAKRIPPGYIAYTVDELIQLSDTSKEFIKNIHQFKKEIGLELVSPELKPPEVLEDPRPELQEDSAVWNKLFSIAAQNYRLGQILWLFRSNGMRLIRGQTSWVLRPDFQPGCFESYTEYEELKNIYLVPYTGEITNWLKILG